MRVLRFDSLSRRRSRFPQPTDDNRAIVTRLIDDLQILALQNPAGLQVIARTVRAVAEPLRAAPDHAG